MARTPGLIIPSAYSSKEELEKDLRRRSEAAGFTPFEASDFDDDEPLAHFGVKGMKWGKRNKRTDEKDRKETFGPAAINARAERARKIRTGAVVLGGAVAIGLLLSQRGRTKITNIGVTNFVQQRQARAQAGKNPFGDLARRFRDVKAASVPSPNAMIADARMAGVRNSFNREGAQRLTDRAWRDQARLSTMNREMQSTTTGLLGNNQTLIDAALRRARGS